MTLKETTRYKMARKRKIPAVKIEIGKNDKVIIRIPYNQELINKIKTIFGRGWNPKEKYWEVPYGEDVITKLQSLFGKNLVIDLTFTLSYYRRNFP